MTIDTFFTTRDVSEKTGVPPNTVRHWTRKGWISFARDTRGRRLYDALSIRQVAQRRNATPNLKGAGRKKAKS